VPVFYVAADTIIPGTIEGEGNYFEITDSEYLNISLESSEPVKIRAESIPEIIMIGLESVSSAKSTEISLSGLAPSTTYYKYQDDFHNLEIFVSDESGNYTYSQNLIESHFIFIQTRKSTKFIKDDPIGGDCASIGDWDVSSKTCTLNIDINQTIQIDNDNVTLDGSGHTLTGTWQIVGVYLYKRTGVTIKNLNIVESSAGIQVRESNNNTFIGNTLDSNSAYGMLFYPSSNNNTVTKNTFSRNRYFGVHVMYSNYNKIYSNNFIGNYIDPYAKTRWQLNFGSAIGNIAYIDPPTGGNYWDDFDTSSEGCNDANNDNFCDAPHVFSGGQDNYPLTKLNGWLEPPSDEPERDPVIIIPGIMGSYLNREDGTEVWMNLVKMLLPGGDSYLDELKLSFLGQTTNDPPLKSENIIRKTSSEDFFDGLIKELKLDGYEEELDLFIFPYDWRLDIQNSSLELRDKIDRIKSQTGAEKVDVIVHSMGGLLLKEYLRQYGGEFIGKFLDLGTPHRGSPKSFKILMYGDNLNASILFGLLGLNAERTKIISQNMPSVYQLLPSSFYGNYLYDMDDLDGNGARGLLSYADTKEFMKNTGRNSTLVDRADIFHQGIDNLNPADYGVKTYNIVGCGVPTLGKIFVLNKETSGEVEYNISYTNGDGTVSLNSAENIPALKTYYAKNAVHATMPSTSGVKELLASILGGDEDFDISLYSNLATSSDNCKISNGKIVSFHSPIELHIYDLDGNHVGPNADEDIEINIPGVSYEVIDGNKFAFLPDGTEYIVKGSATASSTFNARIEILEDEVVVETRYFNQVPITPTTQVELRGDMILIDADSDAIFESEFPVSSVLDEGESLDITKPTTTVSTSPVSKKDTPFDTPVKATLQATDDNSGVLITEYSLNSGQSWILYTEPVTINARGENQFLYKSTDRAGNIEKAKVEIITILYPGNSGNKR